MLVIWIVSDHSILKDPLKSLQIIQYILYIANKIIPLYILWNFSCNCFQILLLNTFKRKLFFFFGMVFSSLQLRLFLLYLSLFFIIFFFYKFWTLKNINRVKKDMNIKFWYIKKENFGQGQGGQVPPLDPPWLRPWF